MRRAVVIAHCDDESIFCGGLIARHPGDWTVIACSVPACPIFGWDEIARVEKFYDACRILGAKPVVLGFREASLDAAMRHLPDLSEFDHIITHGKAGEYGHTMHTKLHNFIVQNWFSVRPLTFFGYHPSGRGTHYIELTEPELAIKTAAIKTYDHRPEPYWQAIFRGFKTWPGFNVAVESYDGHWPW